MVDCSGTFSPLLFSGCLSQRALLVRSGRGSSLNRQTQDNQRAGFEQLSYRTCRFCDSASRWAFFSSMRARWSSSRLRCTHNPTAQESNAETQMFIDKAAASCDREHKSYPCCDVGFAFATIFILLLLALQISKASNRLSQTISSTRGSNATDERSRQNVR